MEFKKNKVLAIIQARYSSSRFPGKVLKIINKKTLLEILIKRLSKSKYISKIIVACSLNDKDSKIIDICKKLKIDYFAGSENNVLDRFYKSAKKSKIENIVRITGDCPLIDSEIVDIVIKNFFLNKVDYASNTNPPTFPDGLDVEIFKFNALENAYLNAKNDHEREHVTPYIIKNKEFKKFNLKNSQDISWLRLTLDEERDFQVIKKVVRNFKNNLYFNLNDIFNLYKKDKNIFLLNSNLIRNEGSSMNTGQKLWKRAKNIIPEGTMLFSKNPDLFLPGKWPAYFSKTKGCKIWDLDNNVFNDISFMGVGTNTLGYSHPDIEKKVIKIIKDGTMSTLNSQEEIILSEKLVSLHPWSEMVKLTRSGGEANAVAIRIARAASGKDKIAICGYHGWHDWYLSSNINKKNNLDSHLMANAPIGGVPKNLKDTVFPFEYNNFQQLKKITEQQNIGIIKMEVKRNIDPTNNFLKNIRKLATDKNIVLIFDECTSGFRQTFGGLHKFYKVDPDIAIFGKALGNGYAINAIIGRRSIMSSCSASFISSTFWTERIGPTAALETLKIMESINSWETITSIGRKIKKKWLNLSKLHKLDIKIQGIDAIPNFYFYSKNNLSYKTLISQEMLKKNILASNSVYCSIAHKEKILNKYFDILDDVLFKIYKIESGQKSIKEYLKSEICLSGMRNKDYIN
jgi:glutamate-1-semialdehyde aminotransferase/spore coat polysaccharide biosynthesis protein SpsF (cytidylyltransferase family)